MGNLIMMLSTLVVTLQADTEGTEDYLRNQEQQQQLLIDHAIFPEEGKQHQQLALSLRNQRLLEEQAESRARQLQYQLQAAEAMHAMRQLSILVSPSSLQESHEEVSNVSFQADLKRFRLLGIWQRGAQITARLAYGDHIFSVRSNDVLLGEIRVEVKPRHVLLHAQDQIHQLTMGFY